MADKGSAGEVSFVVRLYGEQAQQDALDIRASLETQLAQAEQQLANSTHQANRIITSQTRRLGNNLRRIEEVIEVVTKLDTAWRTIVQSIAQVSEGVFDPLVESGKAAYDELVGHSIMTRLQQVLFEIYGRIETRSRHVFDPLTEGAEQAAQAAIEQIAGVVDKAGKLRFPAGTQLEGFAIGGKYTTPEKIEQYNQGLLTLQDVMPGTVLSIEQMNEKMGLQAPVVEKATGSWDDLTDKLNAATLQFFGLRRLGYGLEQAGGQVAAAGEQNLRTLSGWAKMYGEFNQYATRAAAAMEMTAEQQEMLEQTVLDNVDAMRLFTPEEIVDGLRAWAAGTGAVVQTQDELNEIMEQTNAVQVLAALGGAQLEDTMRNVGGAMAEYGMSLDDVERITAIYNFTAAKTFAEVEDMGDAFRLVGPLAASLGISMEETAAALGLLADQNIKGTMAGRAFRQMLIQLVKPTKDHNDAMNRALGLTGKLGDTWQDIVFPSGEFIGLAKYIDVLAASTENLTTEQRNNQLATIATANELPSLIALVQTQIAARKEGINVMRAWTKWSVGIVDAEVEAFRDYMERTRAVQIDTSTNMYNLWDTQSTLFYESESAKLMRYEQTWRAMQLRLGEMVLDEGAPIIEDMLDLLEKLVAFAEAHPQLVEGAIIAAGAELILGNLIRFAGQMIGMVANFLILRGAFEGFTISVAEFHAAVLKFVGAAVADVADPSIGPGTIGVLGVLAKLLGVAGVITAVDLGRAPGQREFDDLVKAIGELNLTAQQWAELRRMDIGYRQVPGQAWGGELAQAIGTHLEREIDLAEFGQILRNMFDLTDEQEKVINGWRAAGYAATRLELEAQVEAVMGELPPELRALLEESGVELMIYPTIVGGLTEEEIGAVELYDEMHEKLEERIAKYADKRLSIIEGYDERELERKEDYLDRREDLIERYQDNEARYLQKHLDKLAALQDTYEQRVADEIENFREKLEKIWEKAARREADIRADTRRRIEKAEADHLKKLRRMQEDHQTALWDLAVKRDAYGIFREMRDYKTKRSREIEDHKDSLKGISEADDEKIAKAREQAAREEADARKSHAKKLADTDKWLADQRKKEDKSYADASKARAKAYKKTLDDLDEQYQKQRRRRLEAHRRELADLREKYEDELDEIKRSMTQELAELLGYYAQGTDDYQQYLSDRLLLLRQYLDTTRRFWDEAAPPSPIGPPDQPPYNPLEASFFDPATMPTRTVVVRGDFAMNITADRNAAEVGVPAAALEVEMARVFDQVHRQLEVSYG